MSEYVHGKRSTSGFTSRFTRDVIKQDIDVGSPQESPCTEKSTKRSTPKYSNSVTHYIVYLHCPKRRFH